MINQSQDIFIVISHGVLALAGVWIGVYLNYRYGSKQEHQRRIHDLQIRSYSKLMGLKIPFSQAIQTVVEAKILCEYYETRARINNSIADLDEAKRQNERALSLIPEVSRLRRSVSETLGEVTISYPQSDRLNEAVQKVYKSQSIDVVYIPSNITSIEQLESWKDKATDQMRSLLHTEYEENIESLIQMLFLFTKKV